MSNKEQLLELLDNRSEAIPVIRDILAESAISDQAYAQIFRLIYSSLAEGTEQEISYSKSTKEWKIGKKTLSDLKLFCALGKVHDIVRCYVLSSWEECILSAWMTTMPMIDKVKADMAMMESLSHIKAILRIASESMEYNNTDGTISWANDSEES